MMVPSFFPAPVHTHTYTKAQYDIPLHTRSRVDTWVPSSMVCRVKSISGIGFFSLTARMAFSSFTFTTGELGSAIVTG